MERRDFVKLKLESEFNPLNKYEDICYAFDSLYLVKSKETNLYGLINTFFEEIVPCEYLKNDFLKLIKNKYYIKRDKLDGLKVSRREGMTGYVDKTGTLVIPRNYQKGLDFNEDLAAVKEDRTWGFINNLGNYQIPSTYESAYSFNNGLAPVKKDSKWGYINKHGEIIVPFNYDSATPFYSDYALVSLDGEYYFIDTTGFKVTIKKTEDVYLELRKSLKEELPKSSKIVEYLNFLSIFTLNNQEIIVNENDYQDYIEKLLEVEKILLEDKFNFENEKVFVKK